MKKFVLGGGARIKIGILCSLIIAAGGWLFNCPLVLTDILSGTQPENFSVKWHWIKIFLDPFYSFVFYVLSLQRDFYKPVLISWSVWTLIGVCAFWGAKKKSVEEISLKAFYAILVLASLIAFTALFPLPGPKLIKPEGFIAVDFHSHTRYSHDNVSTEASSLRFHEKSGYDFFFVTEHQNTLSFEKFGGDKRVLPGMQIQSTDGESLLLLSAKPFDGEDYRDLSIEEIIRKAHQNDILVFMPHWWKWHHPPLDFLKKAGIDGFEVYNAGYKGYRNFDEDSRAGLISFIKENSLGAIGSTDWHGWGYMSNVWTVFEGENVVEGGKLKLPHYQKIAHGKFSPQSKLSERQSFDPSKTMILVLEQRQAGHILRFAFEPFYALYLYLGAASWGGALSFIVWFLALFLFFSSKAAGVFWKYLPLFCAFCFAGAAFYYAFIFIAVRSVNEILLFNLIPAMAGICVLWIVLWRINGKLFKDV